MLLLFTAAPLVDSNLRLSTSALKASTASMEWCSPSTLLLLETPTICSSPLNAKNVSATSAASSAIPEAVRTSAAGASELEIQSYYITLILTTFYSSGYTSSHEPYCRRILFGCGFHQHDWSQVGCLSLPGRCWSYGPGGLDDHSCFVNPCRNNPTLSPLGFETIPVVNQITTFPLSNCVALNPCPLLSAKFDH